jgi:hypothetical protein
MGYIDLNTIHNPAPLTSPPSTYGDQIRDNDEYLLLRGPYICTSSTRPASPSEGFRIYETDTNREWVYTGSAWRLLPTCNVPRCVAQRTSTQTISNSTVNPVELTGTDLVDTDAMHDPAASEGGIFGTRVLLPHIGLWEVRYQMRFVANATGGRAAWICVNTGGSGSSQRYALCEASGNAVDGTTLTSSDLVPSAAATDYIECFVYQSSGGNLNLDHASINGAQLTAVYRGPTF